MNRDTVWIKLNSLLHCIPYIFNSFIWKSYNEIHVNIIKSLFPGHGKCLANLLNRMFSSYNIKLTLILAQEKEAFENSNVAAFKLNVLRNGSAPGLINLVAEKAAFPREILNNYETNVLKGMKVYAILTNPETGEKKILDTVVDSSRSSAEADGTESIVVCCTATADVPAADYTAWTIQAAMCGVNCTTDLSEFLEEDSGGVTSIALPLSRYGTNTEGFRFVVAKADIPPEYATAGAMNGMWLVVDFTPKSDSVSALRLEGTITRNVDSGDNTVVVIPGTAQVPAQPGYDTNYTITLTLYPDGKPEGTE